MTPTVRDTIEKFVADANRHDLSGLSSIMAEDIVYNEPFAVEPLMGMEAVRQDWQSFFAMFPDIQFSIGNILTEGDMAALELKYAGTQTGPISGRQGPPTNRRIEMTCAIFVQANPKGLIKQWREYYDTTTFYNQLGLTPRPNQLDKGTPQLSTNFNL